MVALVRGLLAERYNGAVFPRLSSVGLFVVAYVDLVGLVREGLARYRLSCVLQSKAGLNLNQPSRGQRGEDLQSFRKSRRRSSQPPRDHPTVLPAP